MRQDIATLVELQQIDHQIAKIEAQIAGGYAEIEKSGLEIAEGRAAIAQLQEKIEASEARRRELEAGVEDELARIKERQTKLMNVQTNREYQSLLKEIEDGKKNNKQREEELVLLLEQVESLRAKLTEETNVCEAKDKLLGEAQARADQQAAELNDKKGKIAKVRDEKAGEVAPTLLRKYEMLRQRRNGTAIAPVLNGVCRGCNMNIPPQLYIELQKAQQLLSCPTCNRLMFHEVEEEKV
ncbi:MAG: C4-type zinc ribbon domain-containing protein [Desulfobacteraceae bacterium]|nr:C4-type zinc ribbon domain-containing protein [Desulfobacteraceae bacterium]